jgi:DNA invertase Pin-like site-specific DNA recombinase
MGKMSTNGHSPKKRAVLYARVSGQEQVKGFSLRQQIAALTAYCERENIEIVGIFEDPGVSGATLERPGLDALRDRVAEGEVDLVLAQDLDRISREPWHFEYLKSWFAHHGAELHTLDDSEDGTPMGEFVSYIGRGVAKLEREDIRRRMTRGRIQRAREGSVIGMGSPPLGFRYNADAQTLKLTSKKYLSSSACLKFASNIVSQQAHIEDKLEQIKSSKRYLASLEKMAHDFVLDLPDLLKYLREGAAAEMYRDVYERLKYRIIVHKDGQIEVFFGAEGKAIIHIGDLKGERTAPPPPEAPVWDKWKEGDPIPEPTGGDILQIGCDDPWSERIKGASLKGEGLHLPTGHWWRLTTHTASSASS